MIKVNFLKAPNEDYLGPREFYLNSISIGSDGDIVILKEHAPLPPLLASVSDQKLIITSEEDCPIEFHLNEKLAKLPLVLNIDDKLEFNNFCIVIEKIEIEESPEYGEYLDQQYEKAMKDPKLAKIITQLSDFLE